MEYLDIKKVNKKSNNIIRDGNVGNGNSRDADISPKMFILNRSYSGAASQGEDIM